MIPHDGFPFYVKALLLSVRTNWAFGDYILLLTR